MALLCFIHWNSEANTPVRAVVVAKRAEYLKKVNTYLKGKVLTYIQNRNRKRNRTAMEALNPGTSWNPATLELWNLGTLEP